METKICKHCQTEIPKKAKICPNCRKKQGMGALGKTILIIFLIALIAPNITKYSEDDSEPKKVGNVDGSSTSDDGKTDTKNEFKVGDIVETENLKISFLSADKFKSDNEYIQPKKGNVYYRMQFEFENIGDSDETVSSMMDWSCYADDYSVEQAFFDDDIDASLSPGKKIKGSVYFEVPKDSKSITLEYETNFWTEDKIIFIVK